MYILVLCLLLTSVQRGNDAQAINQMKLAWTSSATNCSGIWATQDRNRVIKEFRGVTFTVESHGLSEADRLNNIQWKGRVRVNSTVQRYRGSDWRTTYERPFMYFEKRNGVWSKPNRWDYYPAPCG